MPSDICLVVPCYNEESRLDVQAFRSFSAGRLLFVDDGSTDGTIEVLEQVRAGNLNNVAILSLDSNAGKAEAVRRGILHALEQFRPAVVGFWDADLATPLSAVPQLAEILHCKPGIEMVFGARVKLLGRHVARRAIRHYPGRVFATIVSMLLGISVYDTQCGAKLFRVEPWTHLVFAQPFLSKWIFDVEIMARYLSLLKRTPEQLENAVYEFPLERWTDIAGSKLRVSDFFVALLDVWRIHQTLK